MVNNGAALSKSCKFHLVKRCCSELRLCLPPAENSISQLAESFCLELRKQCGFNGNGVVFCPADGRRKRGEADGGADRVTSPDSHHYSSRGPRRTTERLGDGS